MLGDTRRFGRTIVVTLIAAIVIVGFVQSGAEARRRRHHHPKPTVTPTVTAIPTATPVPPTGIVQVQKTVVNGQITAISGKLVTNASCLSGRDVDVIWGPDTAQQNPFGSAQTGVEGSFSAPGSAPNGSYITIQIESVDRGAIACGRAAYFGQP